MSKRLEDVKAELSQVRFAVDQINTTIQTLLELQASQILSELKQARSELNHLQGKLNALTMDEPPLRERVSSIPIVRDPMKLDGENRQ